MFIVSVVCCQVEVYAMY